MKRATKIVCTLGPSVDSFEKIRELVEAGMNVARLNCSHGDWETRAQWVEWVRQASPEVAPVAIMADLQGPKFRVGPLDESVTVERGQRLVIDQGMDADLSIPEETIWEAIQVGDDVLFGDGDVRIRLVEVEGRRAIAEAKTSGEVKSRTGVTVYGKSFDAPALTAKDLEDIDRAMDLEVDAIALSYVKKAVDMRQLRRRVGAVAPHVRLAAKLETAEALADLDGIISMSDVVMVARGDLGLQIDIHRVPLEQKRIIQACNRRAVPVITATQMLESMVVNARPTRAEASDVFNAILDGTDAVMLSGETAVGKHPIAAAEVMAEIAEGAEAQLRSNEARSTEAGITGAVARSAVELADELGVAAILACTTSGTTPRMISSHRPGRPILAACWSQQTQRAMAFVWGVEAVSADPTDHVSETAEFAIDLFMECSRLKVDDRVVVVSGYPAGTPGNTNLILVQHIH